MKEEGWGEGRVGKGRESEDGKVRGVRGEGRW